MKSSLKSLLLSFRINEIDEHQLYHYFPELVISTTIHYAFKKYFKFNHLLWGKCLKFNVVKLSKNIYCVKEFHFITESEINTYYFKVTEPENL